MKKQKMICVKWNGPDGSINSSNNDNFLELFDNSALKKYCADNDSVTQKDLAEVCLTVQEALKYLREIFGAYDLVSSYHNFAHNYVTSITAFRAFIGALKLQEKLVLDDLKNLIIVSLFHDTGYLQKSDFKGKANVVTHIVRSLNFMDNFVRGLKWKQEEVESMLRLGGFTNYSEWDKNKNKINKNVLSADESLKLPGNEIILARLLVGADFMQVVDINYFENLQTLTEFLKSKNSTNDNEGQKSFFDLSCEITQWIWKYLDAFYDGRKKNPYRNGWEIYERGMEEKFNVG